MSELNDGGPAFPVECQHSFPDIQDFCTHLGHETLGAHCRHYVCRNCGALKSMNLGGADHISSARDIMQVIYFWEIIRKPHRCVAGWRGQIVVDCDSSAMLKARQQ